MTLSLDTCGNEENRDHLPFGPNPPSAVGGVGDRESRRATHDRTHAFANLTLLYQGRREETKTAKPCVDLANAFPFGGRWLALG